MRRPARGEYPADGATGGSAGASYQPGDMRSHRYAACDWLSVHPLLCFRARKGWPLKRFMRSRMGRTFRIVSVTHFFPSRRGGIELVAAAINRRLAERGHAVAWFASADAE